MDAIRAMLEFMGDGANWGGTQGIANRLVEHLWLSLTSTAAAAILAIALGLYIGHTRRFEFATITIANLGRALPSFAILAIAFPFALRFGISFEFWPTFVALFLLAIPPILINTYTGVREIDRDAIEAGKGMGMDGRQILRQIEIPLAAPLIVSGIRTSAVQVIATATLAAFVAGGGLGRFIVDGFARQDDGLILTGAVLVAVLAMVTEIGMALLERAVSPKTGKRAGQPGVGGRARPVKPGGAEA